MPSPQPRRGEVWLVALGAGRRGEPAKTRPAVVMTDDALSTGDPMDLIAVIPITSSLAPSLLRVELGVHSGLERPSRAICRAVRAVTASRMVSKVGDVSPQELSDIESALAVVLGL